MVVDFRSYLRDRDDPRLVPLRGADARAYADRMHAVPRIGRVLDSWRESFETTPFTGITPGDDGTPVLGGVVEGAPVDRAVTAAEGFLAALTPREREQVVHPFNSRIWRAWMNPEIYMNRFGVRLDETSQPVRDAALGLMRSSLSDEGFLRARSIMKINGYLGGLVGSVDVMNQFSYNVNVFGTPSLIEPWGWHLYGHHLAVNCTFVGELMVLTPAFFGSEPTAVPEITGDAAGLFESEEQIALELLGSLSVEQRDQVVLFQGKRDPGMPADRIHSADELNLAGAFQDNRVIPYEGLSLGNLGPVQRRLAIKLAEAMLAYQPESVRAARLDELSAHLGGTYFCWIGGSGPDDPFYFRLQGPSLLLELDHHAGVFLSNSEPMRFHAHTIVRTPYGNDYGAALAGALTGHSYDLTDPEAV